MFRYYRPVRKSLRKKWYGFHTDAEWQALKIKYNNCCLRCRKTNCEITRDHIIAKRNNGMDTIDNIQPLCRSCNSWKQRKYINYRIIWDAFLYQIQCNKLEVFIV